MYVSQNTRFLWPNGGLIEPPISSTNRAAYLLNLLLRKYTRGVKGNPEGYDDQFELYNDLTILLV